MRVNRLRWYGHIQGGPLNVLVRESDRIAVSCEARGRG